jgi:hypothetical protein
MKAPSSHMIALTGFWLAAAMFTTKPPLHAANDNIPSPHSHHGGEQEPTSDAIRPEKKGQAPCGGRKALGRAQRYPLLQP